MPKLVYMKLSVLLTLKDREFYSEWVNHQAWSD
jgi:hypothetical protein